jgi:DNA-binding LytR/AlgR family response regulator
MKSTAPTAILAEDERVLRDELRQRLGDLWPELRIVGEASDGLEAIRLFERERPSLMFLDIQMPGMTGIDVAQHVQGRCHVVFVTAYDAYAIAAFDAGALDYVLKPIDLPRLASSVARIRQRVQAAPPPLETLLHDLVRGAAPREYLRWINASVGQAVRLITVDEVLYFQADTKYTRVITADGEALIRKSLKELQDELDPAVFWAIHRSTIVNANAISGVARDFRGRVHVKLKQRDDKLAVSEAHEHMFRQM